MNLEALLSFTLRLYNIPLYVTLRVNLSYVFIELYFLLRYVCIMKMIIYHDWKDEYESCLGN